MEKAASSICSRNPPVVALAEAYRNGWTVVDMKQDWKQISPADK